MLFPVFSFSRILWELPSSCKEPFTKILFPLSLPVLFLNFCWTTANSTGNNQGLRNLPESRSLGKSIKRNKQISSQTTLEEMEISPSSLKATPQCLITLTVLFFPWTNTGLPWTHVELPQHPCALSYGLTRHGAKHLFLLFGFVHISIREFKSVFFGLYLQCQFMWIHSETKRSSKSIASGLFQMNICQDRTCWIGTFRGKEKDSTKSL